MGWFKKYTEKEKGLLWYIQFYKRNRKRQMADNPNGTKGLCEATAVKRKMMFERQDIPARVMRGTFKGKPHSWCEYRKKGKWYVDDPSIWYVGKKSGFERPEFKTRGIEDYQVSMIFLEASIDG